MTQNIAKMACLLGTVVADGCDTAHSITGCPEEDFGLSAVYEDDSCLVVASLATDAIAALIKPPIQCNGTTNPVLMVRGDGSIIRRHGETYKLEEHLLSLVRRPLNNPSHSEMGARRKAPWVDFQDNEIYERDILVHPSGESGTVVYLAEEPSPSDAWRVDYGDENNVLARLCLQIGDKGQGVIAQPK